jgi:hypothetical protein
VASEDGKARFDGAGVTVNPNGDAVNNIIRLAVRTHFALRGRNYISLAENL